MNKCIFIANLTRDPESKQAGEMTIVKFTGAVNRKYKREGEPTADFLNFVAFGKTAEFCEKWLKKGTRVAIVSHVQTGSYMNKEGKKVYTTDFVIDEIEFAGSKSDSKGTADDVDERLDEAFRTPVDDTDDLPF